MAEHIVLERGFWSRLFFGPLRLEHRPDELKLVVRHKGQEQFISFSELKRFTASGRTLKLELSSASLRFTWLPPQELQAFSAAVNKELRQYHDYLESCRAAQKEEQRQQYLESCRKAIEAVLVYRQHYVRDSEWEQCSQAVTTLRQCLAQYRQFMEDNPLKQLSLAAADVAFLQQLVTLTDESKLRSFVRENAEQQLLAQYGPFLNKLERYPLNAEQQAAVVRTNDRNLILAAAGTGKTSVIVAKALFLLQSGAALPEDILILSYNRAAAAEINERLKTCAARVGIDATAVRASTFHALGRSVLVDCKEAYRVTAMATDEVLFHDWINRWLFTYLKEQPQGGSNFINLFMSALLFDAVLKEHTVASEHDKDKGQQTLLQAPPEIYRTLNNEQVKSRQELHIANWLATHGVPYKYEDRYLTKLRLDPGFDYSPDFHIIRPREAGSAPDNEPQIYLEHYGIDREGNTKPGVDKAAYNALIERKRQVHQEYGTILLETYSYQFTEKTIDDTLEELMKSVGIPLRALTPEELLETIKVNKSFTEILTLLHRCLQVIREFGYDHEALRQRYQAAGLRYAQEYADFFTKLTADYRDYLASRGEIDFCDMIGKAAALIAEGKFQGSWRYILVDEFQDISLTRLNLLQRLLSRGKDCVLTCVGDDWQAIYHFAGGFLEATVHFERYFGAYTLTKLVQTYRYPQSIADTAGTFVQENPQQFRKDVVSLQADKDVRVHLLEAGDMGAFMVSKAFCHCLRGLNYVHSAITSAIAALCQVQVILKQHPDATIAVISRYNSVLNGIAKYLENIDAFPANALVIDQRSKESLSAEERDTALRLCLDPALFRPRDAQRKEQLKEQLKLWTMHKAKGLESDYVVVAGVLGGDYLSFPCRIKGSEILECLLDNNEDFKDAEERRLFYVSLTRAKHDVYLIADAAQPVSDFVAELLQPKYHIDLQAETFREAYLRQFACPVCGRGIYQAVAGPYSKFYSCSNPACKNIARVCAQCGAPSVDHQGYSECTNKNCQERMPLCERCGRPLKLKTGPFGQFYGCSGFGLPQDACTFKRNYKAVQRLLQRK